MQSSGPRPEPAGLSRESLTQFRAPAGLGLVLFQVPASLGMIWVRARRTAGPSTRRARASTWRRLLEDLREAHLSAAPQEPPQDARFSRAHEDRQWPPRNQQPAPQGAATLGCQRLQKVSEPAVASRALRCVGGPPARRPLRFTRRDRLRKRFEFRRLRDQGKRVHTPSFVLQVACGEQPHARLGVTVSRQVGKAARRNRLKRLLREAFRQQRELFPASCDLVVIAKPGCAASNLRDVQRELQQARAALRAAWDKQARNTRGRS